MKKLTLFAALMALLIVGCAKKDEAGDTGTTGSTASSTGGDDKKTTENTAPTEGKDATKEQLVGTWTAEMNEEGDMKMFAKMTVTLNADDTYSMEMAGNFEGDQQGIKMSGDIEAKQTGKWKLEAGSWTNTPDAGSTTGGVSNFKYEASDPKMQEALKGQQATMEKTFQENFTKSLEDENKQTLKSVSSNEMVTENTGKTVTWKKS